MHFTVVQWLSFGSCMNWQILFTEYDMFGLVSERYCKLPTTVQKRVTTSNEGESNLDNLVGANMGQEMELASSMCVFFKISVMYIF